MLEQRVYLTLFDCAGSSDISTLTAHGSMSAVLENMSARGGILAIAASALVCPVIMSRTIG